MLLKARRLLKPAARDTEFDRVRFLTPHLRRSSESSADETQSFDRCVVAPHSRRLDDSGVLVSAHWQRRSDAAGCPLFVTMPLRCELVESRNHAHQTPKGAIQRFQFSRFRRLNLARASTLASDWFSTVSSAPPENNDFCSGSNSTHSRCPCNVGSCSNCGRIAASRRTDVQVESPGGISPPGAPRTVREPLDSYGSRCSTVGRRAAGFASSTGSSCCQMASVGPWPRLNNAAPSVQPHYRAFVPTTSHSAPDAPRRYSRPRGFSRLRLLPLHRSTGSPVPYKSLVELRAASMPDAAWAVSGIPQADPGRMANPPVLTSSNRFSTRHQRFACARLSQPCLTGSCPAVSATLTTVAF